MKILVTGAAGFIGYHVSQQLLARGEQVLGVDVMNDYYDPRLKNARLEMLQQCEGFEFERMDLADRVSVLELRERGIGPIIHLAAQAGVRYSIEEPLAYLDANLAAWLQVLELGRAISTPHLVMASSSSVYGSSEGRALVPATSAGARPSLLLPAGSGRADGRRPPCPGGGPPRGPLELAYS